MKPVTFLLLMLFASASGGALAGAAEHPAVRLVIKDHQFLPSRVTIPAGTKVQLVIENQDPTPEEFESYDLNREKMISAGKTARVFIGPLKAGVYTFFGEFHPATAQGEIVVETAEEENK